MSIYVYDPLHLNFIQYIDTMKYNSIDIIKVNRQCVKMRKKYLTWINNQ